ncbi:Alpha/Beta hydrolase protein [Chytriomyces sp. MP71]|nr:Alpha/Beta hydrolase protein [Chytriomyces sp. MP71]
MTAPGPLNGYYALVGASRLPEPFKLWHRLHGNGPTRILLIMGLNISHQSWDFQYNYFGALPGYSVLVFDNRGVGFSDCPKRVGIRYTTSDMALDTLELLQLVGWDRCHVVGISMGGMIALELATKYPDMIKSLSLTSTTAGGTLPPLGAILNVPKIMFVRDPKTKIQFLRDLIFPPDWLAQGSEDEPGKTNKHILTRTLMNRTEETRDQTPAGAIGQLLAVLSHHVSPERLKIIVNSKIPVFIATGTWENLVDPANSAYLASQLKPRIYKVFEGGGHAITTQFSKEYNALLKGFIDEAEKGGGERTFSKL